MKNYPNWSEWILQKNNENRDDLNKGAPALMPASPPDDGDEGTKPKRGRSVFNMEHARQVASMKDHAAAKKFAHDIVDASSANPQNKKKIKMMINMSKSPDGLATAMANHVLAHPGEGLKVLKSDESDSQTKKLYDEWKEAQEGVGWKAHFDKIKEQKAKQEAHEDALNQMGDKKELKEKKAKFKKSIDWSEWILQKNKEVKQEELKKSDFVVIEDLQKNSDCKECKGHVPEKLRDLELCKSCNLKRLKAKKEAMMKDPKFRAFLGDSNEKIIASEKAARENRFNPKNAGGVENPKEDE